MIYGYARVSTKGQKIERQVNNIMASYPDAKIFREKFTGTKMERPIWCKLNAMLKAGDTVVFDEVSRMSRNAEEGVAQYEDLVARGVSLVFLKQPQVNSDVYKSVQQVALVGNEIADCFIDATNKVLLIMARTQIRIAFDSAQEEVDHLHDRVAEGMAASGAGEKISAALTGKKYSTKKADKAKKLITDLSKDFGGTYRDAELMEYCQISRPTFYKYKAEIKQSFTQVKRRDGGEEMHF